MDWSNTHQYRIPVVNNNDDILDIQSRNNDSGIKCDMKYIQTDTTNRYNTFFINVIKAIRRENNGIKFFTINISIIIITIIDINWVIYAQYGSNPYLYKMYKIGTQIKYIVPDIILMPFIYPDACVAVLII